MHLAPRARVTGNKLVFKGEAFLQLLCRGEDGNLFTGEFHLPYSQIMDAGEESEDGVCHMDLLFTDVKCTPAEEDRRSFQVELAVQAQAVLRREVTLPVLTDLYSTTHELETQRDLCPVCRLVDQGEEQESLRETVEIETMGGAFWTFRPAWGVPAKPRGGVDSAARGGTGPSL